MDTKTEGEKVAAKVKSSAAEGVVALMDKKYGKGTLMRLDDQAVEKFQVISTGSLALDRAIGIGGYPRGRIIEIYGPESCLDAETFIQYEVHTADGGRHNHKGGSVQRLYERFHGLRAEGDGRGKYARPVTEGAQFFAPSLNEEGRVFQNQITNVVRVGDRACLEMVTQSGLRIVATPEHRFFDGERYVRLADLRPSSTVQIHNNTPYRVADQAAAQREERAYLYVKAHPVAGVKVVAKKYAYHRLLRSRAVVEAEMNGLSMEQYVARLNDAQLDGLVFLDRDDHVHHQDEDITNDDRSNLVVIAAAEHSRLHALERHNNLRYAAIPDVVESITPCGVRSVYDVKMLAPFNNFVAAGFVTHNSGKTTLTLHAIAEVQKGGGTAAIIDAEHALDPGYARALGVRTRDLLIAQPDYGEQALEICDALVQSAGVDLVVIDSVAALVPKAELDGDMGDSLPGLHARLMSQAMRKLTAVAHKSNTTVIFINQLRQKIGVMYGNPEVTTGGNALKFYASIRLDVRKRQAIKDGNDAAKGNFTEVKVVKNKMAPPFRTAEFEVLYGKGIDRFGDLLNVATELNIVGKSGSWFSFRDERIGNGRDAAREFLEKNPEVFTKIVAAVYAHDLAAS